MLKHRLILLPVVLSAALLVSACGGGGSSGPAAPDIAQNVSDLIAYMKDLIAGTSETSEPIDINPLKLAVDDTAEPSPL